jgi:hypothetical protein
MPVQSRATIAGWFLRGMKPLAAQFSTWLDSFVHKDDAIPMASITGLEITLGSIATITQVKSLYRETLTLNADGTYVIPVGNLLETIIVEAAANMNLTIGKTNGNTEVAEAIELLAGVPMPIPINIYAKAATTLYFNGITAAATSVTLIILKNPL